MKTKFADFINEGRFPFFVDAYKVNCDTNKISPLISFNERFILFSKSEKIRMPTNLLHSQSASSLESDSSTPTNTKKPVPIFECNTLSIVTDASETR